MKLAVKCEVESPGTSLEKAGIDAILSTNPDSQGWQLWSRAALQSWATSNPIDLESDVEVSPTGDLDGVPMLIWAIKRSGPLYGHSSFLGNKLFAPSNL